MLLIVTWRPRRPDDLFDDLRGADHQAYAESERQTFHDCVEQAVLGEKVGLDRIWAVEHHALVEYAHWRRSSVRSS
jgi:alkanesulfonate monooxygenase SsuD/methylene tetrahydromethanopterin reductase-like flavin-dependent oxidoreductase (luciferase family)